MVCRVVVERFDGVLFVQIVLVGGLGRAENVLQLAKRIAEEVGNFFGIFRLFDRLKRFRRGLLDVFHHIVHLVFCQIQISWFVFMSLCFRRVTPLN